MEDRRLIRLKIQLLFSLHFNGYLKDIRLFKAFLDVPLKDFIPNEVLNQVRLYDDAPALFYLERENPTSIRTISAPHMISIMLQNLILNENDNLLILGAKSGYIATLAHKLAPNGKIVILEANSKIAKITANNLNNQNIDGDIEVIVKNPLEGFPELCPWKKILVTGAITQERIYPLLEQLDSEGVLFAPIGENYLQTYTRIIRFGDEFFGRKYLQVRFTPLITQLELDELKLVTDIELEAITEIHTKRNPKISNLKGNITVNYNSNVLDEVRLKPYSKDISYEIYDLSIHNAIVEFMNQSIDKEHRKRKINFLRNVMMSLEKIMDFFNQMKEQKGIKDPRYLRERNNLIKRYLPEVSNIHNKLKEDEQTLLLEHITTIWERFPQQFFNFLLTIKILLTLTPEYRLAEFRLWNNPIPLSIAIGLRMLLAHVYDRLKNSTRLQRFKNGGRVRIRLLLMKLIGILAKPPLQFVKDRVEYETWGQIIENGIENVNQLQDNNPEKESWDLKFSETSKKLEKLIDVKIEMS
ncbi:MAG: hypothetical protein EAX91_00970 [Candidatus Lokiarchaeota archaeon]|nr:hypothetical protein [Candidatus Lokiarchaeota archaeon]